MTDPEKRRATVTTTRAGLSEYDSFGPWIDEVTTPDEVPPLYRDFPLDLGRARLVIKVPRAIDRRDATPDMDLYDHLLVVDEVGVTALSRRLSPGKKKTPVARGYDVTVVPYARAAAVLDTGDLLDCRLALFTAETEALAIRYNASGRASIARLIAMIRDEAAEQAPSAVGRTFLAAAARAKRPSALDLDRTDPVFVYDVEEIARRHAGLAVWTCHERVPAVPREEGWKAAFWRVAHAVAPVSLNGGIVAGDSAVVEIVGRREWLARTRDARYSRFRLTLPLGALARPGVRPHHRYADVSVVRFDVGGSGVEIALPDGSAALALFSRASAA